MYQRSHCDETALRDPVRLSRVPEKQQNDWRNEHHWDLTVEQDLRGFSSNVMPNNICLSAVNPTFAGSTLTCSPLQFDAHAGVFFPLPVFVLVVCRQRDVSFLNYLCISCSLHRCFLWVDLTCEPPTLVFFFVASYSTSGTFRDALPPLFLFFNELFHVSIILYFTPTLLSKITYQRWTNVNDNVSALIKPSCVVFLLKLTSVAFFHVDLIQICLIICWICCIRHTVIILCVRAHACLIVVRWWSREHTQYYSTAAGAACDQLSIAGCNCAQADSSSGLLTRVTVTLWPQMDRPPWCELTPRLAVLLLNGR